MCCDPLMFESDTVSSPELSGRTSSSRAGIFPYAVFACALVFFWSISARAIVYTLMPTIASALSFSSATAGLVVSSLLFGYCAGGWASGWLPGSRKARILAGVALSLPATVAISQASGFLTATASTFVMGFGIGVYLPLGMALIVDVGRGGRAASYMSIHEFAATLASFIGSAAIVPLLAWTDWHGSVLAWCGVGILALVAFLVVRDPEGDRRRDRRTREPVALSLKLVCAVFTYGVGTMLVMGIVSMLALILVRAWGVPQTEAASVVGYTRLAGMVGVATVGLMADRLGHSRVLIGLQSVAVLGLIAMSLGGFGPLFIAGVVLLAVGASGNITLNPVVIAEAFPSGQRERVMAYATGAGGFLGMVVAPALFGLMLDTGLGTGPIMFTAVSAFLAILVTGRIGTLNE